MECCITPTRSQILKLTKRRAIYFRQKNGWNFRIDDPRYMIIYDNGGLDEKDGSSDRYTVIFTREINTDKRNGKRGTYWVTGMNDSPTSPQGICLHSEYPYRVDKPSYKHLGRKICFNKLPSICQRIALQDYIYLYDLCVFER